MVFLGLFLGFFCLELILRIGGAVYYKKNVNPKDGSFKKDCLRVLCLGDSFCFGVGASFDKSFPQQLQELFNTNNLNAKVYNHGIPGTSSSLILRGLESRIHEFSPDIIVLIAGRNDVYNLLNSNYFIFDNSYSFRNVMGRVDAFFSSFCVYKLIKEVVFRIGLYAYSSELKKINCDLKSARMIASFLAQLNQNDLAYYNDLISKFSPKKNKILIKGILNDTNSGLDDINNIYKLAQAYCYAAEFDKACEQVQKGLMINCEDMRLHNLLGNIYYEQSKISSKGKKEKQYLAIFEYIKVTEKVNENNYLQAQAFCNLAEIYWVQTNYNKALIAIKRAKQLQPRNKLFDYYERVFTFSLKEDQQKEAIILNKLLLYNLDAVASIAKKRGIYLIMLGYPGFFNPEHNAISIKIANKNNFSYINFYQIFNSLIEKGVYSQEELFASDFGRHCSAVGYQIMANKIFKIINAKLEILK